MAKNWETNFGKMHTKNFFEGNLEKNGKKMLRKNQLTKNKYKYFFRKIGSVIVGFFIFIFDELICKNFFS